MSIVSLSLRPISSSSLRHFSESAEQSATIAELEKKRQQHQAEHPGMDLPHPDGKERANAKVQKIVDDILNLSVFESVALAQLLKVNNALFFVYFSVRLIVFIRFEFSFPCFFLLFLLYFLFLFFLG